ncbi:hypothetical protein M116_2849 [Bacteroides fragilis str. 3719 A10]|nr:hypothetical protein M073_2458 [Bacteroides fragilis str. DS-71]EXZ57754.1 hypothetical protein M116_2849 [Bacteroides fragilis str. 3719 A10]
MKCIEHGYCDLTHFIKRFKRFTGKVPLQYYKQNIGNDRK